jgi:hypothetical protein
MTKEELCNKILDGLSKAKTDRERRLCLAYYLKGLYTEKDMDNAYDKGIIQGINYPTRKETN